MNLNHRRPSTDLREIEPIENTDDVVINVPALVQERIRIAKQQAVKIEIPEEPLKITASAEGKSAVILKNLLKNN